jgi:hypothetical protein
VTSGGDITLGPVTNAAPQALTVTAGTGDVLFNGTVGSGMPLGTVGVTADDITLAANAVFAAGAVTVNNAGTFTANAGAVISAGGIFRQTTSSGPVSIAANIAATSAAPLNAVINFANTVTLAANVTFSTPSTGGSLSLGQGESRGASPYYTLTLNSNGGAVSGTGVMTLSQGASSTLDNITVAAESTVRVAASNTVYQDDGMTLALGNNAQIDTAANTSARWDIGGGTANFSTGFGGYNGKLVLAAQAYLTGNLDLAGFSSSLQFTLDFTGGPSAMDVSGDVFIDGDVNPLTGDVSLLTPVKLDGTLTDLTLRMTGTATLEAKQPIGKFNAAGVTTIKGDTDPDTDDMVFGGDVTIETGHTLIAGEGLSPVSVRIRAMHDWTQWDPGDGIFTAKNSVVEFGHPNPSSGLLVGASPRTYTMRGNTTWYNLECHEDGATMKFSNYQDGARLSIHTHTVRGSLSISPVSANIGSRITLDKESPVGAVVYPPPSAPDEFFWYFDLEPPATLQVEYVNIFHSFSRRKIPVPQNIPGGSGVDVNAQPYYDVENLPLPPADPSPNSYFNVDWFVLSDFIYSFAEDSDHNGRIDRIRLQAAFDVTDGPAAFAGFVVDQIHDAAGNFYEVDTAGGGSYGSYGGYRRVERVVLPGSTDLDSIYVYLKEKPYSDGNLSLHWRIARNTTLRDRVTGRTLIGNDPLSGPADEGWTTDTVPPRVNYALAVPGHNEIFFQMSEPVLTGSGGISVNSVDLPGTIGPSPLRSVGGSESEFIISLTSPYTVADLYDGSKTFTLGNTPEVVDKAAPALNWNDPSNGETYYYLFPIPKYPATYGYDDTTGGQGVYTFQSYVPVPNTSSPPAGVVCPPNNKMINDTAIYGTNNPYVHRVSDALVSVTPSGSNSDRYFVWPVWARYYPPANPLPAGGDFWGQRDTDTGIIWDFSGKRALEDRDAEIQVRMSGALSAALGAASLSTDVELKYGLTVPLWQRYPPVNNTNGKGSGGLWLPDYSPKNYPVKFINLVPSYYASPSAGWAGASGSLYNFIISKDAPGYESVSRFDFVLRVSGTPQDLFAVRLDALPGEVPSDWYRRVRPWSYDVHNVRLQRGGVTILNNVINPTKGEKVSIRYHLVNGGRVTVQVFTLDGNMIKVLFRGSRPQGEWIDVWDGKNNGQRPVARGMYFVRVVGPDIDEIRKVMVVK